MKGTVTRVSKFGLQLNDQATWYNWANDYADHPHVDKDQVVNVDLNEKGYVVRLDLLNDSPAPEGATSGFRSPLHIIRQGALEAAVEHTKGTACVVAELIEVARDLEEYILHG